MSREKILEAIRNGRLKMRPRWHFWLRTALVITGALLVLLALLDLTSFVIFNLRQSGAWFGPSFGLRGWSELLVALPWWLVGLSLIFIGLLEVLTRRYALVYRRSLVASLLILVLVALLGGIILGRTPLHRRWPQAGRFYQSLDSRSLRHFARGVIVDFQTNGFILRGRNQETVPVRLSAETRFPFGSALATGTAVVIWGQPERDGFRAFGVRPIGTDD